VSSFPGRGIRVPPDRFGAREAALMRRAFEDACAEETPADEREKGGAAVRTATGAQRRVPAPIVPVHGAIGRSGVHPRG
jgi:hypothetical protein